MQPKVIKVGNKKVVYSKDGNKVVKSTTTYNVNPDTGAVSEAGTTKETISEDGAKDKVVYSKDGNKVVKSTTTYNVNPDTGAVTEAGTTKETISEDGAKDKVVYSKEGNKVVKSTTTYNVNPDTGAVTEAGTTKETISEDGAKDNGGNDASTPADKTVVANPDALTDAEKAEIIAKIKAVNPDKDTEHPTKVVLDEKGNATVTTPEGKTAVIPASDLTKTEAQAKEPKAGNDIVKPADKTVVRNPELLTDTEKKTIEDKVKAVNPGATVAVDDKGNATVTVNGKTAVIPAVDLTKSAADAAKPKAGNDVVKPADKTVVRNPELLTDTEKKAIEDKVKAVNPGATVVVDEKGNVTVTPKDGEPAVIPASDLTKSAKAEKAPKAGNDIVKPASKTKVANPDSLTSEEKKAIENKVRAVNPEAKSVVVDEKGNATVTLPNGNTAVIPSTDLVKVQDDAKKDNGGNDANTPAAKTVVKDPVSLTDEEKAKVKKAVEVVNPGSTVVVDEKGNATVTKADGTVLNIPASDLVIPADNLADEAKNAKVKTPAFRTLVGDKENLTDEEKATVKEALIKANSKLKDANITISATGEATIVYPDGQKVVIPAANLVVAKGANNNAGTDANAGDKATDADSKDKDVNAKAGQRLANTGATQTNTGLAGLGLGILGAFLAVARRRKEK